VFIFCLLCFREINIELIIAKNIFFIKQQGKT